MDNHMAPVTHRVAVEPGSFWMERDEERPDRHVFVISTNDEHVELAGTLDGFVVIAHNMLALVVSERSQE